MLDLLVGDRTVVLKDVVVGGTGCVDNLLQSGLFVLISASFSCCRRAIELTRTSARWSSGMSASFSPWYLGITSYRMSVGSSDVGRRTYSMTLAERTNVEESEGLVAFEKLEARDFTCN